MDKLYEQCGVRTCDAWTWLLIAGLAAACVISVIYTGVPSNG